MNKRNNNNSAANQNSGVLPGWIWFVTGLTTGIFVSFLFYLWHHVPTDPNAEAAVEKPGMEITSSNRPAPMKWDFYSIFSKSKVPVTDDYGKDGQKTEVNVPQHFILQAGAFRTAEQADQRRAQLILLGLQPFIKVTTQGNSVWHRVMLGPIDSRLELDREHRKLADANIPSIFFHVPL